MCSPSRATFLTGTYPSRHGVTLTMTEGDLLPDPRNLPDVLRTVAGLAVSGEAPRGRLARAFARGLLRLGPKSGNEPELPPGTETLATLPARARLPRRAQGQVAPHEAGRRRRVERRRRRAHRARLRLRRLGAAGRRRRRQGRDLRRRQRGHHARGLGRGLHAPGGAHGSPRTDLPEPFCLVFSLVNPHDVLGYPSSYERGGYSARASSATCTCPCRRRSTRTCATSRRCRR